MISWMQKHRKYLVVTIWISTIAFVGAGFVGWGAYDYNKDRASSIAKVGEKQITIKEYQNAYSNLYNYYNELFKGEFSQEKAKELKLDEIALQQLMREALLLNYANEFGLTVNDEEIIQKLQTIDAFKKDGVFNKEQYYQVLKGIRSSAKEFEESLKKEILLNKLKSALNLPTTSFEVETIASSMFMADKLEIKMIKESDTTIEINEDELKKFWENSKANYMTKKSYELQTIDVSLEGISNTKEELQEFYNEKKHNYKDAEGKILAFDQAKEKLDIDLKFKKAKKNALKQYLAFKKSEIKAQNSIKIVEGETDFPLDKLQQAKKGEVVKPIELKDRYVVAKLEKINFPEPMQYVEAKELAKNDLTIDKKYEFLEKRAKEQLDTFSGKDIGFISRDDVKKISDLSENEAMQFLNQVFTGKDQKGYYIYKDKAILYKITEQKLLDEEKLAENKEFLTQNIKNIKSNEIEASIISLLEKKYSVEKYN